MTNLYLHKLAASAIEDSKSPDHLLLTPDWYEGMLLARFSEADTNPHGALGGLAVICADLLEIVRRTDPSYQLTPLTLEQEQDIAIGAAERARDAYREQAQ